MSIDYQAGADGIATLTWQMSDVPMNVLNAASMAAYAAAVRRAIADPAIKGVIVTSAKPEFIAGGDLNMLLAFSDAQAMMRFTEDLHALMRGIEKSGKPFVAALNGSALGGGYEVALATAQGALQAQIEAEGFHYFPIRLDRGSTNPIAEARSVASVTAVMARFRPDVVHLVAHKLVLYGSIAAALTRPRGAPTPRSASCARRRSARRPPTQRRRPATRRR